VPEIGGVDSPEQGDNSCNFQKIAPVKSKTIAGLWLDNATCVSKVPVYRFISKKILSVTKTKKS
jgi:hypothetical protein